jgi:colanic acid biosynthesis glycosyl transferase WcaI
MPASRIPRVIFVNRFYWPDEPATAQLLTDLAEKLAGLGHEVTVIAGHPGGRDVPREAVRHGVRILRVRSTRLSPTGGLVGKAVDFATFFTGAMTKLISVARRDDAIVALTDPPLLGIGAAAVARWREARLFHWVQDIFPEIAVELTGQRWLQALLPSRNAAWRRADRIVTIGRDMSATIATNGVAAERIAIVPNWAPDGLAPQPSDAAAELRADWDLVGKFVVAYSGNLGRVHDLTPVLDVAEALRDEQAIAFVFIGGGAQREALKAEATRRGLPNLQFRPAQPRGRLAQTLALGDVHLVTLRPGGERYVFPSKLYGIATVGRPVIFIGPRQCEIARQIEDEGFGRAFTADEIPAIAAMVKNLQRDPGEGARFSRAAVAFARASGDATAAAQRWHLLLAPGAGLAPADVRS